MDERICLHESGHAVIGVVLGWTPGTCTVVAGSRRAGCTRRFSPRVSDDALVSLDPCRPFVTWPHALKKRFEDDVVIGLAGGTAEMLLGGPEPAADRSAETARVPELAASLPPVDESERDWAAAMVDVPGITDMQNIEKTAWAAHGDDWQSADAWLVYLAAQCRRLVLAEAARIRRLAAVLAVQGVISGEGVAALMAAGDAAD